jgi:hypothetical protein
VKRKKTQRPETFANDTKHPAHPERYLRTFEILEDSRIWVDTLLNAGFKEWYQTYIAGSLHKENIGKTVTR